MMSRYSSCGSVQRWPRSPSRSSPAYRLQDLPYSSGADLPRFTPPAAEVLVPLVSSDWPLAEQCRSLRESKAYLGGEEGE